MSKSGVLTVPSLSEVTREYELNRLRLVMDARKNDGFLFDRNLYSYDYAAGAVVASWDAGLVAASASYATYPGLMSVESGVLSVTYDFGKKSRLRQTVVLTHDSKRLDFMTEVEWHEAHRLIRVAFRVVIHAGEAAFDIQY